MSCSAVYLDIRIGDEKIGRIVAELFHDKAPKSASNFYHLCKGDIKIDGNQLSYKNNYFHRIVKNFIVQAGDIIFGSGKFEKSDVIGKGGCSIYSTAEEWSKRDEETYGPSCFGNFPDENLGEFDQPFYLAMANLGVPDSNSSQFFITTCASPHLNGKHSIFGRVTHGKSVVHTIENSKVDEDGFPLKPILIEDCGEWQTSMGVPLFNASNSTLGGDIYEEYPDDDQNFDGESFAEAYKAANTIKESGTLFFKKQDYQNALFKYKKSLRYLNEYIPDTEIDEEHNLKFTDLKMKLYLNISLVLFKLQRYDDAITQTDYLLDMEGVQQLSRAKAFYRRGNCHLALKRLESALEDFKKCKENNPDDTVVDKKIQEVEDRLNAIKQKTKKNIAKFFS
ncbi:LAFE_0F11804g1_1 [Lachancea fermentati]|uniref:peptidylprolyl isomerase n=1 Tax=Lachancea fermentati TaxID=4955 RepID=A0A1G4MFV5_LACFM|nr:LAFE_0F11804g1_1 [Lachancea fermentati]